MENGDKCPKCESPVHVIDTDMWTDVQCTNPSCDYGYSWDWEEGSFNI